MSPDRYISEEDDENQSGRELQDPDCGVEKREADRGDWALLGESAAMQRLLSQIQRIGPFLRIALIRGEARSGRQAVARAIHALSPAANGPFVVLHATALTDALGLRAPQSDIKSALAAVETARGGTLYLRGCGGLSLRQQALLYPFAQTAGLRILAESDRDLRRLGSSGKFRHDLYACLSAVEIVVPPLRERTEDIPALAAFLLQRIVREAAQGPKVLSDPALLALQRQFRPNNLHDLEHVLTQAAELAQQEVIEPSHLARACENQSAEAAPARLELLEDVIERHVLEMLARCGGNKVHAAEALGISRSTLYRMLETFAARGLSTGNPRTP